MSNINDNRNNASEFDTVELLSVYLEGYILTPVAILGIIGKILLHKNVVSCESYKIIFVDGTGPLDIASYLYFRKHYVDICALLKRIKKRIQYLINGAFKF